MSDRRTRSAPRITFANGESLFSLNVGMLAEICRMKSCKETSLVNTGQAFIFEIRCRNIAKLALLRDLKVSSS